MSTHFAQALVFASLTLALGLPAQTKPEFVALFEGKSLAPFVQKGGKAKYTVEDGVIVGTCVPATPNTFLCTKKHYGDFILEYEFRVHGKLNSGVQIRSHSIPTYRKGRVHGYQVEIDPDVKRNRMWTAGIYDESRRGWLNNLADNEPARLAFRPEQWNKIRVAAVGDSLKTWLNGVPAADLVDSMTQSGFIGLQVHGVGKNKTPMDVRWRNLRIKDLGRHVWKRIFDGKSLDGWSQSGGGTFKVVDGAIVATNTRSEPEHGHLFFDTEQADFTIRLQFKAIAGNSGLYFRTAKKTGKIGIAGLQAEIDAAEDIGGLYETRGRAWLVKPKPKAIKRFFKRGEWNEMSVSAHGDRIVVHVNGRKTAELKNDTGRKKGFLALQLHGGQDVEVHFKDIELLVPATPRKTGFWPGFRGPNHDGVAPDCRPPTEWSEAKNLAWKLELPGPGASSPIVVGNRIYVVCYTGYGNHLDDGGAPDKLTLHFVCVDRTTGALIRDTEIPGNRDQKAPRMQLTEHGFASPTPVTDGNRIFAYLGTAGVVAFNLDGGKLWQTTTGTVTPGPKPTNQVVRNGKALALRWGAAASPVLSHGLVIVNASEESNSIRAYDQETGELRWKYESPNLEGCAASPVIAGPAGERVLIVSLGGEVWGIHPATGELAWRVETGTRGGMSPTPVSDGRLVYTFGGLGKSFALRLGEIGATKLAGPAAASSEAATEQGIELPAVPYSPRIAWQGENLGIPSPALFHGQLILVRTNGMASSLSTEDGTETFKGRLEGRTGSVYASPIIAGGNLYVVSRKRGTFVYSADGKFKLIARNEIDDDAQFNASPAIVGDRIYLRSDKFLYCIAGS